MTLYSSLLITSAAAMWMTEPGIPGTGNDRTRDSRTREWPNPETTEPGIPGPGNDRTRERPNPGFPDPGMTEPGNDRTREWPNPGISNPGILVYTRVRCMPKDEYCITLQPGAYRDSQSRGGVSRGVPKWRKLGGRVDDFFENFWKSFIICRKFWEFFYNFWKIFENFLFFFENFEKFLIIFQKFWEIFANQRVKKQNLRRFRERERSWDIL
jgi:hypothetical protein